MRVAEQNGRTAGATAGALFRFAVLGLRLPPRQAWALTLPELALLLAPGPALLAPDRAGLQRLMARFPDETP